MTGFTIHFKKPAHWAGTVHIHFWQAQGKESAWPGVPMEAKADGWYSHRFHASAAHFVFNDGHGQQTCDLHRDRDGWYDEEGHWHNGMPTGKKKPSPPPFEKGGLGGF